MGSFYANKRLTKRRPSRLPHWTYVKGIQVGKREVRAVYDSGAQRSLVTRKCAERLGLRVDTRHPPILRPIWTSEGQAAHGRSRLRVTLAGAPAKWLQCVIADVEQS